MIVDDGGSSADHDDIGVEVVADVIGRDAAVARANRQGGGV
ncbi:hypothetical protein [Halosimplex rubrum]|nr:hypothetical protein [Halosimplex rubrum]